MLPYNVFASLIASGAKFEGEGTSGDTGQSGTEDVGQKQDADKDNKDNDKNNDDNLADLWNDPVDDKPKDQIIAPQPDVNKDAPDPNKAFDEYIDGLNLGSGVDVSKISEELNQGNTDSLNTAFATVAKATYKQTMIDVNKIIDSKVEKGVAQAISQSSNAVKGDMAVQQMHEALKFTSNPAIRPVAIGVLTQLIKKGKDVPAAIDGVKMFFQQTSRISAKELGQNAPRNRPGNQTFRGPDDNAEPEDKEDVDWVDMLNL